MFLQDGEMDECWVVVVVYGEWREWKMVFLQVWSGGSMEVYEG